MPPCDEVNQWASLPTGCQPIHFAALRSARRGRSLVDNVAACRVTASTVTIVTEPTKSTAPRRPDVTARPDRGDTDPVAALSDLGQRLGAACDDLFGVAPFPGDQVTGHDVNRHVDEIAGALRSLQAEVDDLARAMTVARSRRERGQ